jgi:tetrapyrrole methylase family protein / MazG family protein
MDSEARKADKKYSLVDLLTLMATLRGPSGCPWDRKQTEQTLKKYLIEEAYEVLEAIETGTPKALQEELGDLLLQIIFLSRIAEEKRNFDFSDVIHTLAEKLIRRHPHVFPPANTDLKSIKPKNATEVTLVWRAIKDLEGKKAKRNSLLGGLPLALPALEVARRISERVLRKDTDQTEVLPLWEEVEKRLTALHRVKRHHSNRGLKTQFGDLLLALASWATRKGFSPEESLRAANLRFAKRFDRLNSKSCQTKKITHR